MILQNHVWVKDPFKVQGWPLDFNIAEREKLIDTKFHTAPLRNYLSNSCVVSKIHYVKRLSKYFFLSFLIHICTKLDFLHILQLKQHNTINTESDMRVQLSSVKPDIENTYKSLKQILLLIFLKFLKQIVFSWKYCMLLFSCDSTNIL